MFEKYFEKYDCFVITVWDNKLCVVPCDDTSPSGFYPDYDKAEYLSNINIDFNNIFYDINDKKIAEIDAILFIKNNEKFEMCYAENSWDGFQIVSDNK